jgi:hypothetical protein
MSGESVIIVIMMSRCAPAGWGGPAPALPFKFEIAQLLGPIMRPPPAGDCDSESESLSRRLARRNPRATSAGWPPSQHLRLSWQIYWRARAFRPAPAGGGARQGRRFHPELHRFASSLLSATSLKEPGVARRVCALLICKIALQIKAISAIRGSVMR